MASAAEADALVGRVLDDRYRVEQQIGAGGMGSVYRGRHVLMDRKVALKILRPDLAHDQTAARRFAREAKSAFRFDHPNCVRVSDFGITDDGLLYLVMELLDGRTVGDELHYDGAMSGARVAHVARQVCDALDHAHSLGLVHRDLKPDNVMLLKRGEDPDFVKVLDFGLAKLFEGPDAAGSAMFSMAALTQEGTVYGTPEYMSPEQATGQSLDPRSDLYSLGVVMYEMVSGMLPFQGGTYMATLTAHVKEQPRSPIERRPDLGIAPELDALIMQCLAKNAGARPASAAELSRSLAGLESALAVRRPRLPREVAASETMDLSQSEMARQDIARSETVAVTPTEPVSRAGASALTTNKWAAKPAGGRRWMIGLALAMVAAAVVAIIASTGGGDDDSEEANERATVVNGIDASVAAAPPSNDGGMPQAAQIPDAGPTATADARSPRRRPNKKRDQRRARRAKAAAHLAAARSARRAGKTLKQIAEADQALRLGAGITAAYLLGDGLVRSGDKANGCRYLHRSRRLRAARERAKSAGCPK